MLIAKIKVHQSPRINNCLNNRYNFKGGRWMTVNFFQVGYGALHLFDGCNEMSSFRKQM